ncbi:Dps family protein [Wenyingzhuangia sp. 2_MG-2023]|uniref:Dps family protein n=1 Tax=Wenyingzhuangia sp. 2_MG-2023 TaxID=3062639 RepID=UPI0026E1C9B0|nr:DNA starvation/stationary phase protection protein [Wenyingzhuangia sp. 2_MG-2023]MDO6737491.1 DNA starvation/stationary phase protection protein [Wenyingzhuangia sp. 2_MG-2023]
MNYLSIDQEKLTPVVSELNSLLAEYHIYYQKLRNFHWNIKGQNFFDLHVKFEEMYKEARLKIDEIAERILTLRKSPVSRYSDYLTMSKIKESSSMLIDKEMVVTLIDDHQLLLERMTNVVKRAGEANDEGTIDLIGAYIRELEKTSWMLEAWNQETDRQKTSA